MTHSIHQIGKDIIVCSDETIKAGDKITDGKNIYDAPDIDGFINLYKIISSNCGIGLPLTNSIENLNQLWDEFESERLAKEFARKEVPTLSNGTLSNARINYHDGIELGFLSGRKSKQGVYTLEDMIGFAEWYDDNSWMSKDGVFHNIRTGININKKELLQLYKSQLSIHEGKVLCEITSDSITVTKYL